MAITKDLLKTTAVVLGCIGLVFGVYYGFAASPDYNRILTYSIFSATVSAIALLYYFAVSEGAARLMPAIGIVVNLMVAIQAIHRLIS